MIATVAALALYGRNALEQTKRSTNRGRCEHDAYPVEVLAVEGGKKIALCLGCGRAGPVRGSSTEALMALREIPRLAYPRPLDRWRGIAGK